MQDSRASRSHGRGTRRGIITAVVAGVLLATALFARPASDQPAGLPVSAGPAANAAPGAPSYTTDVTPILSRSCFRCHGPDRADKGLRLDSYQRIMAGDSYGAILIPGDSSLSAMVSVIRNGTMPHDSTKLTAAEIGTLSRWIDAGAPQN